MKCNVGKTDKSLRIIVGIAIILAGVAFGSWLGLIGIMPIVTGFFRYCPAYTVLGVSTSTDKK